MQKLYEILVDKTAQFFKENNIEKAVIGLSGGIDSALVATILVDALGKDNVLALFLSSAITSDESRKLAFRQAELLDINITEYNINDACVDLYRRMTFGKAPIIYENIQSRMRGVFLLTYSNMIPNSIVVSTGNRSEGLLGYCTIQGDTTGGFNPIGYLYKTEVYELANYINSKERKILQAIIDRVPTAELYDGQSDEAYFGLSYSAIDTILVYNIDTILRAKHNNILTPIDLISKSDKERILDHVKKNKFKYRYYAPSIPLYGRKYE